MEGVHLKGGGGGGGEAARPQLLDLIPGKREWMMRDRGGGGGEAGKVYGVAAAAAAAAAVVERQLELRLGPPGGGDVGLSPGGGGTSSRESKMGVGEPCSLLSLGSLFSSGNGSSSRAGGSSIPPSAGAKRGFLDTLEDSKQQAYQPHKTGFFGSGACKEESSGGHKAADGGNAAEEAQQHQPQRVGGERKAATCPGPSANADTANDRSQTRTSQAPVVGWPPIRSFRKNIAAASSSKPPPSSPSPPQNAERKPLETSITGNSSRSISTTSRLVKINMDGVPIGRKVDLTACSSYDRLSAAVDHLFRGLLTAQRVIMDHGTGSMASAAASSESSESTPTTPAITGLLDGSGEYTLVYEDNEGDRMLVGDVPWEMFMSTVKRLRVLKTSELPSLSLGVAGGTRRKAPSSTGAAA